MWLFAHGMDWKQLKPKSTKFWERHLPSEAQPDLQHPMILKSLKLFLSIKPKQEAGFKGCEFLSKVILPNTVQRCSWGGKWMRKSLPEGRTMGKIFKGDSPRGRGWSNWPGWLTEDKRPWPRPRDPTGSVPEFPIIAVDQWLLWASHYSLYLMGAFTTVTFCASAGSDF